MLEKQLSANTLFHFTSSLEVLESILINEFKPRYCLEDQRIFLPEDFLLREYFHRAIPMVCFCDIPLSQIRNHATTYGSYSIGLSKEWAKANKINPITYSLPESSTTELIKQMFAYATKYMTNDQDELRANELIRTLNLIGGKTQKLINFLKPYEGQLWRNGAFSEQIIRFYDEREWRYIPELSFNVSDSLSMEDFLDVEIKNKENQLLARHYSLSFEPKDIKYIIVKDETEVLKIVNKIERIKRHYSYEDVKFLTSKIITMKQIIEDF